MTGENEEGSQQQQPLAGLLHVYDTKNRLVFFESGVNLSNHGSALAPCRNSVIFVGGLSDGLAPIPALPELSAALSKLDQGWSLIQPVTRSSYLGWTTGDIDRDVEDLITLERYLRDQGGKQGGKLVLLGHSTGCQDLVRLFQLHGKTTSYDACILQAPVSDREYAVFDTPTEDLAESIAAAEEQIQAGGGAFPLPWQILDQMNGEQKYKDPITANRWLSLVKKGGKEDFFSSDLDDDALNNIFAGFREAGKPILFLMSGKDACVPPSVDKQALIQRFITACDSGTETVRGHIIKDTGHSVEDAPSRKELVEVVVQFAQALTFDH